MIKTFYVYMLYRDTAMTDPFYVGKGTGTRMHDHESMINYAYNKNNHKNGEIKKCITNLGFVPKEIFRGGLGERDAFQLERDLIALWGRHDKGAGRLTNHTDGGDGVSGFLGRMKSLEERAKLSASLKGKPKSEIHKERLRQANLGKTQSAETRAKNSASNRGRTRSKETCQKLSKALSGRSKTAEHCLAISNAKKGKRLPREVYDRQAASRALTMAGKPGPNLGRVFSAESRERLRQGQRKRWAALQEGQANG